MLGLSPTRHLESLPSDTRYKTEFYMQKNKTFTANLEFADLACWLVML